MDGQQFGRPFLTARANRLVGELVPFLQQLFEAVEAAAGADATIRHLEVILPQRLRQLKTQFRLGFGDFGFGARLGHRFRLARAAHRKDPAGTRDARSHHSERLFAAEQPAERSQEALRLAPIAGDHVGDHARERRVHALEIFADRRVVALRHVVQHRLHRLAVRRHLIVVGAPFGVAGAVLEPGEEPAAELIGHKSPLVRTGVLAGID